MRATVATGAVELDVGVPRTGVVPLGVRSVDSFSFHTPLAVRTYLLSLI
jgi:hypothetical protein